MPTIAFGHIASLIPINVGSSQNAAVQVSWGASSGWPYLECVWPLPIRGGATNEVSAVFLARLALVFGGASLAAKLHVSAPIVMVVAGLIIGNHGRRHAMSDETRRYVDGFWVLIDEILNALLFALIGLELLVLPLTYIVVLVSILVQGLTIGPLARSLYGSNPVEAGEAH